MSAALHLFRSPEVAVCCTTTQNKGPTSEVINPGLRGKEKGVKMTRERVSSAEGQSRKEAGDQKNTHKEGLVHGILPVFVLTRVYSALTGMRIHQNVIKKN